MKKNNTDFPSAYCLDLNSSLRVGRFEEIIMKFEEMRLRKYFENPVEGYDWEGEEEEMINHNRCKKDGVFALGQLSGDTKLKQGKIYTREYACGYRNHADT